MRIDSVRAQSIIKFVDTCEDAILILNEDLMIEYANQKAGDLFPILKERKTGKIHWDMVSRLTETSSIEGCKHLKSGNYKILETHHKATDGWFEIRISVLDNFDYLVVLADITDRKLAENALIESERKANELAEEFKKADELKNNFISTLGHEFRNPLATMSMGTSLLDQITPGSKTDMETRGIIKRQTAQLLRLVDDLLNTSKIMTNKLKLIKKDIEINEIVKELIGEHKALFSEKEIELKGEYCTGPVYIYADPMRIKQALGNLLSNALKFTEKEGTVKVTVSKDEKSDDIFIEVIDTGAGIEPELSAGLFEPFIQLDNSLTRNTGGLGLGLSIVKGIVDLHNGTIEAGSEGLGMGTRFILRFPNGKNELG